MGEMNWLFLDMNSFFASAEQHLREELRGLPVGVVPVESERTCVIAASIEAKAHGVRTGTRVPDARKLCPGIQLVGARPDTYVRLHRAIAASIDKHLPIHKAYSIDEWAMRLVGPERKPGTARALGERIKAQIREDHGGWLPCSVGIAPTRLLAKIACELKKPDGLSVLGVEDLPYRLAHLGLTDLTGISGGIASRLERHGVRDVERLWGLSRKDSERIWGSCVGGDWWAGFHGIDEAEVRTRKRSISHANVLEPRLRNEEGVRQMLARLVTRLGTRLRREGMLAERLSIQVDYMHGALRFESGMALGGVRDTPALLRGLYELWEKRTRVRATPVKAGACVSGLVHESQASGLLFGGEDRGQELSRTLDVINRRWGTAAAYFGSLHGCSGEMDEKIAFGRVPEVVERGVREKKA